MNSDATRAVLERLDGGDALDPERGGEALVGVRVELGERDLAVALVRPPARAPGVSWRHGPHHAAQKSTTTGSSRERSMTSCSKVASVTSKITASRLPSVAEFTVERDGVTLAGRGGRRGHPRRAAARPDRDAPLRRHGLARARARRPPRRRLRRARARPLDARRPTRRLRLRRRSPPTCSRVLDDRGIERAVLAGASMGAHTIVRLALDHRDRVAGLVLVTPAYTPEGDADATSRAGTRCREGLRTGGVEGFVAAYGEPARARARGATRSIKVLRQRLAAHEHPDAVADALQRRPALARVRGLGRARRARPADGRGRQPRRGRPRPPVRGRRALRGGDPRRASCARRSRARSPLAWQGGQLSKVIAELAARAAA